MHRTGASVLAVSFYSRELRTYQFRGSVPAWQATVYEPCVNGDEVADPKGRPEVIRLPEEGEKRFYLSLRETSTAGPRAVAKGNDLVFF